MVNPEAAPLALIFDMDGVVVDNHQYHLQAWLEFCSGFGIALSEEEFTRKLFGGNNKAILEKVFGRTMTESEIQQYADRKEALYREIHLPHLVPLKGISNFLDSARNAGIPLAIATAAPRANLEFVLHHTGLDKVFDFRLDESDVVNGKPDPEIYLKAAAALGIAPESCVVFEDSLTGIRAAQQAGMRVVGVMTSLDREQLGHTWKQIHDFTEISINLLRDENPD